MDSVNSFQGYDKVDEDEERAFLRKTRRRIITIGVSIVVLIGLIIGAVIGLVVHHHHNQPPNSTQITQAVAITAVCSVTQYPKSCVSSLSSASQGSNIVDPLQLFKLSMQVAVEELSEISSIPDKLMSKTTDARATAALLDCKQLFRDSINQLNSSISWTEVSPGENFLSTSKVEDIRTWLSSATTEQETCLDGLEQMDQVELLAQMKKVMQTSKEYTSNSLAIVAKIMAGLVDLQAPLHRKLLEHNDAESSTSEWVHPRLLQETRATPDMTVAADGSGDYKTISEAVAVIGMRSMNRTVIYVKQGKYNEYVYLSPNHWNVTMYGDGSSKTIVSGNRSNTTNYTTFAGPTFIAEGDGFVAIDMGFENTAGPEGQQAVAVRTSSDRSVFYRCKFDAYQDTLCTHIGRQFYRECKITGTIDFIFGYAPVIFQNCTIEPRQPLPGQIVTITAQGNIDTNQNGGISIHRSKIIPLGNVTSRTYLGRPWKDYSRTIIMETVIGGIVDPMGWIVWENDDPPSTIFYAEYNNTGSGASVDKRVKWKGYEPMMSKEEAAQYTVESFLDGNQWLPQTSVTFDPFL